jgi:hypothetical protein
VIVIKKGNIWSQLEYGSSGSGKTEFAQDCLRIYDLMRKQDFVYTGLLDHKNIIYENITNHERFVDLMKMFPGDWSSCCKGPFMVITTSYKL